jgi:iron complex outermembrane receptor protein
MSKQRSYTCHKPGPKTGVSVIALIAFAASVSMPIFDANAAEDITSGIEEIIITARKTEESLQRVPLSVTALTGADLELRSANNLADALRFVPNVTFTAGGSASGSTSQVYIRGIGQIDFSVTSDPGVGTYVDGVYLGRSMGSLLNILEPERIEVLRGPQGTLFGRNTIGGAVSYTSRKPTEDLGGSVEVTGGNHSRIDARASLNIPIVKDQLLASFTVATFNRDGYQNRLLDGKELGNQKILAGRATVLWHAASNVDLTLTADGTRQRQEMMPQSLVALQTTTILGLYNATVGSLPGNAPITSAYITSDPYVTYGTGPSYNNLDNWGVSGVLDIDVNPAKIKSITAYRKLDVRYSRESDGTPLPYLEVVNDDHQNQFSQELQLTSPLFNDKVDFLAGLYYFRERAEDVAHADIASGLYQLIHLDQDRFDTNHVGTDSYAVFSEVNIHATSALRLTLGGRYSYEKKTYSIVAIRPNSGTVFVGPVDLSENWSSFTPRIGIDYQVMDDLLLFASFSKGFKSGGFNGRANSTTDVTSYNPEKLDNFEVGFKSDILDRHVRLNASAFLGNYNDMQVNVIRPVGLTFLNSIDNAGKARIKGIEVEAIIKPMEGLLINGSFGYTDAKYLELASGVPFTVDKHLIETPKWTANVGIQYGFPIGSIGTLTFRGDYFYRDRVYHDVQNSALTSQGGYGLINAKVSLLTLNDKAEVAAFGTNLTNKHYNTFGIDAMSSLGFASVQYARPREWGIKAKYTF